MTRLLRHLRDRLADAVFVLIAGVPWVGDAMQRALDRRRDAEVNRRLAKLEARPLSQSAVERRWDAERMECRNRQRDRAAQRDR